MPKLAEDVTIDHEKKVAKLIIVDGEGRNLIIDGEIFPYHLISRPVVDDSGDVITVTVTIPTANVAQGPYPVDES